jgi:hypothetical protein
MMFLIIRTYISSVVKIASLNRLKINLKIREPHAELTEEKQKHIRNDDLEA